jgi:hypothetical protein
MQRLLDSCDSLDKLYRDASVGDLFSNAKN